MGKHEYEFSLMMNHQLHGAPNGLTHSASDSCAVGFTLFEDGLL